MAGKDEDKNSKKATTAQETFVVTRADLRRLFVALGISETRIATIFASMEKKHRHMNAIAFASILDREGNLDRDQIANVLRRIGLDDIVIRKVLNGMDVQKIIAESGKLFDATILFQ
ncbi:MAG: hypothetical protein ACP5RI_00300 [Candidatus Micrarchaeia archaeon]